MCCSFSIIQGARVEITTDVSNFTPQLQYCLWNSRENVVYIKFKQTNVASFLREYIQVKFVSQSQFVTVRNMSWEKIYAGMGTTDGMNPIHICYKEGYFHYECGNWNMFIWLY
jgi:hypothetical protein